MRRAITPAPPESSRQSSNDWEPIFLSDEFVNPTTNTLNERGAVEYHRRYMEQVPEIPPGFMLAGTWSDAEGKLIPNAPPEEISAVFRSLDRDEPGAQPTNITPFQLFSLPARELRHERFAPIRPSPSTLALAAAMPHIQARLEQLRTNRTHRQAA